MWIWLVLPEASVIAVPISGTSELRYPIADNRQIQSAVEAAVAQNTELPRYLARQPGEPSSAMDDRTIQPSNVASCADSNCVG
ncbi:hypothetical protein BM221_008111 [Beauveria bassiana]|uniref:Uncharacterized protein n=1 Tax=Beauveria bassiana TaxID=176275 RepID=A0A2N6NF82_BEABA|nr:hypothetical protein BM221_008111 [Beauveria bassiana]